MAAPILYFLEVIHTAQAKMPGPLLIHCRLGGRGEEGGGGPSDEVGICGTIMYLCNIHVH